MLDLLLVAILAAGFEFTYAAWSWSVNNGRLFFATSATFLMPLVQLAGVGYFVDADTWQGRLAVALATGAGYSVGTAALMLGIRLKAELDEGEF